MHRIFSRRRLSIIAIINLDPHSFYRPSIKKTLTQIIEAVKLYLNDGADIIDVGAVSTAPSKIYGDRPDVSEREELKKVESALKVVFDYFPNVIISVDTQRAQVAEKALSMGAQIINDVSGFKRDAKIAKVVAEFDAHCILMACRRSPGDCCTIDEVMKALTESTRIAVEAGVSEDKIAIDPGIGFGKDPRCDLHILRHLNALKVFRKPICISPSRKFFVGHVLGGVPPEKRLYGSLAAVAIAVYNGATIVRTHDVKETLEAAKIAHAIGNLKW